MKKEMVKEKKEGEEMILPFRIIPYFAKVLKILFSYALSKTFALLVIFPHP